ncbi:MAG: hypothetical protein HW413_122 [Thermoleophilia bacterium]|nr:hypothetical protein [Thermoleophilia bacterium]
MQTTKARQILFVLGWLAATLYVLVGVGELILADDPLLRRMLFLAALTGFAALVVIGIRTIERRPWPGAALASVGAVLGGFSLFWTVLAILLAIAIVVLSVLCARRDSASPAYAPGS